MRTPTNWIQKLFLTVLFAIAGLGAMSLAKAQGDTPTVNDLGERVSGETYPFKLVAQNMNCNKPQDFRFNLDTAPFILALEDPVARQVAFGQSKSLEAVLDLTGAEPGVYEGQVTIDCETCINVPFVATCRADRQFVNLKLTVIGNPDPVQLQAVEAVPYEPPFESEFDLSGLGGPTPANESAQPTEGPTGPVGDIGVAGPTGPDAPIGMDFSYTPNIDPEMEQHLTGGQKNELDKARKEAKAAALRAANAEQEVRTTQAKKGDCWEELARLRAEQAQKEAAASASESAAEAAQDSVNTGPKKALDAAQKRVDDFQRDVDRAQRDYDHQTERALAQQRYLQQVIENDPDLSTRKGKNAKKFYENASGDRDAAKANLDSVKASMAAREAARDAAKRAYDAAQEEASAKENSAQSARTAATQAKAAADAKERECLGLDGDLKAKEKAAKSAKAAAARAKAEAERADKKAKAQAKANLRDKIKAKKAQCDRLKKQWDLHFRRQNDALKALHQSGYFKRRDNAAKPKEPKSLWDDYKKLGYEKFFELAAQGAEIKLPGGVPTAGNVTMLFDILEAAYRIAGIVQSKYTPDTYMHGRTEGQGLRDWLIRNKFAKSSAQEPDVQKDAIEVEKQMRRLKDPKVAAKDLALAISQMEKCKQELAELSAEYAKSK